MAVGGAVTREASEEASGRGRYASVASAREAGKTLLILSQVYVPDPAAVGQHVADVAAEMTKRGHRVVVLAAGAGYDDPSVKYKKHEVIDGVQIRRFPLSSFGKSSVPMRLLAGTIFMLQCMFHGLFVRRVGAIMVSTSPPMCSVAAIFLSVFRRAPVIYWVMDLNPDQMIVLGKLKESSLPARFFNFLNRRILQRAEHVIALDRFMAGRINRKVDVTSKLTISPPWAHEEHLEDVPHDRNPFREKHGLQGKTVIMYSGNHGFSTPVTTVLQAALKLQDREDLVFMFIGGGVGKQEVERVIAEHQPRNVVSLPYQPLSEIKYSLSAADVHVVTVGATVVGVVHPCKVYGAMALARPVLLIGPDPCHVSDILAQHDMGWHVAHGDVDAAVNVLRQIADMPKDQLAEMGRCGARLQRERFNKSVSCGVVCEKLESSLNGS